MSATALPQPSIEKVAPAAKVSARINGRYARILRPKATTKGSSR